MFCTSSESALILELAPSCWDSVEEDVAFKEFWTSVCAGTVDAPLPANCAQRPIVFVGPESEQNPLFSYALTVKGDFSSLRNFLLFSVKGLSVPTKVVNHSVTQEERPCKRKAVDFE